MSEVKVYGADWCKDSQHTREQLDGLSVAYDYINIEEDAESADWVKRQNDGKERKPTLQVGGRVLSVPDDDELERALRAEGLLS